MIISSFLSTESLNKMFKEETPLIVVNGFYPNTLCNKLSEYFLTKNIKNFDNNVVDKNSGNTVYIDYGVKRVGCGLNTVYDNSEESLYAYLSENRNMEKDLFNFLGPYVSPIERFKTILDQVYDFPVAVASIKNKKAGCGIARIIYSEDSHKIKKPHTDSVPMFMELTQQFAANVYIQLPKSQDGGELQVWDKKNNDFINYKPQLGDLVIFNTRMPHAVKEFTDGCRISMQTFFGITKKNKILLWH